MRTKSFLNRSKRFLNQLRIINTRIYRGSTVLRLNKPICDVYIYVIWYTINNLCYHMPNSHKISSLLFHKTTISYNYLKIYQNIKTSKYRVKPMVAANILVKKRRLTMIRLCTACRLFSCCRVKFFSIVVLNKYILSVTSMAFIAM